MKYQLADYLQYMRTDDVLTATQQAKTQGRTLLEDQGITLLALLLADFLADTLGQGPVEVSRATPAKSTVPA